MVIVKLAIRAIIGEARCSKSRFYLLVVVVVSDFPCQTISRLIVCDAVMPRFVSTDKDGEQMSSMISAQESNCLCLKPGDEAECHCLLWRPSFQSTTIQINKSHIQLGMTCNRGPYNSTPRCIDLLHSQFL